MSVWNQLTVLLMARPRFPQALGSVLRRCPQAVFVALGSVLLKVRVFLVAAASDVQEAHCIFLVLQLQLAWVL